MLCIAPSADIGGSAAQTRDKCSSAARIFVWLLSFVLQFQDPFGSSEREV